MKADYHDSVAERRRASAFFTGAAVLVTAGILAWPCQPGGEKKTPGNPGAGQPALESSPGVTFARKPGR